jgi:ethanolamine utilization protein EutA
MIKREMGNKIISVGIDIGTTTTQVVFSQLIVENKASSFLIPEVKITGKKIIYRGDIYFTPLLSKEEIDLKELKKIITKEYKKAGIEKENIATGAIIITGETARKENAESVLKVLSNFAGDFVVATAGADLEAVLAGYGAGAGKISKKFTSKVVNFDVGGGTTNVAMFWDGEVVDSFALDIGGRLISFDENNKISYISEKIKDLIKSMKLDLQVGIKPRFEDLKLLTEKFVEIFIKVNEGCQLKDKENLFIEHKNKVLNGEIFMFSGGVSEFVFNDESVRTLEEVIKFKDIGPLLGASIKEYFQVHKKRLMEPKEKIRATVIGAGSCSVRLSGSTIVFCDEVLPIKNIPIVKLFNNKHESINDMSNDMSNDINEGIKFFKDTPIAVAFKGPKSPSYQEIKIMARSIVEGFSDSLLPIIVVVENDFAKALGQSMGNLLGPEKKIICVDGIRVDNGDYVDIGKSISNVVPVVIKTLIFKN